MSRTYRPIDAGHLPDLLAERLVRAERPGRALRAAVDGAHCAHPISLAESLVTPLRTRGRPTCVIAADTFWRDASLRLEFGREDADSFARWLDDDALRREVLDPLGPRGRGRYLPSLRDPHTNRATRAPARAAADGEIVIIAGQLLLGRGLPFDVSIHLATSPAARQRRTDAAQQWTLPAFLRYEADVRPLETADIVIRVDDPRHPAIRS